MVGLASLAVGNKATCRSMQRLLISRSLACLSLTFNFRDMQCSPRLPGKKYSMISTKWFLKGQSTFHVTIGVIFDESISNFSPSSTATWAAMQRQQLFLFIGHLW